MFIIKTRRAQGLKNILKQKRQEMNISQEKLARLVDTSFRTIQHYEKELPNNVVIFLKILKTLNIEKVSDIMKDE